MSEVKRYTFEVDDYQSYMECSLTSQNGELAKPGEYVLYNDYAAMEAENASLRKQVEAGNRLREDLMFKAYGNGFLSSVPLIKDAVERFDAAMKEGGRP